MAKKQRNFRREFESWLNESLKAVPKSVKGLSFNLFETGGDEQIFGVELVGTSEFDASGSDWACDEIWEPDARSIEIPASFSGEGWVHCLSQIRQLLVELLLRNGIFETPGHIEGVALGFVDGDLEILWRKDEKPGNAG